jgi:hypothetical protein
MAQDPDRQQGDGQMLFAYKFGAPPQYVTFDFLEVGELGNFGAVQIWGSPLNPRRQPSFVPGEYILEVKVTENRDDPDNQRSGIQAVHFTVVEP